MTNRLKVPSLLISFLCIWRSNCFMSKLSQTYSNATKIYVNLENNSKIQLVEDGMNTFQISALYIKDVEGWNYLEVTLCNFLYMDLHDLFFSFSSSSSSSSFFTHHTLDRRKFQ